MPSAPSSSFPGAAPIYLFAGPAPCAPGVMVYPTRYAYPTHVVATSPTTVEVTYNEDVDPTTVAANAYGIELDIYGTLPVSGASVSGPTVTLTTAQQTPGQLYHVQGSGAVTVSGHQVIDTGESFSGFTPPG